MRIQKGLFCGVIISTLLVLMIILANSASSEEVYRFERMWPTLQQPWYFYYPDNIVIDNLGHIYVVDSFNDRIQKFTSEGQFVTKWGSRGSGDGQFSGPYGIAIDSSRFAYVADTLNDRIQKFTSDGQFVATWGSGGFGDGQFKFPCGIAIDSSGFVYVADKSNSRIQKFTSEGQFVAKWGSRGSGDGQFESPEGIATDSSGFVYVVDTHNDRIQKFTLDGQFVSKWGSRGSGDGQFYWPDGIATDSSGFVYVADSVNARIQKFTSDGQFVNKWGSKGSGDGQFYGPEGITTDSGFIYVVDSYNDRIQKFTSDGQFVAKWGSGGFGDGQFKFPYGIATDSNGFIYVADYDNDHIQKFTSDGQFVAKWGSFGFGDGQFNGPEGIATDSSGFVYVGDANNHRIQKFTSEGQFMAKWGIRGFPGGITTDSSGFVYVTIAHNIQKFTSEGQFVTEWGSYGSGDGQLLWPSGIATDSSGFVYVADNTNRIQKFTSDGQFVNKWGSKGSGDGQFMYPEDIATDSSGFIYVADKHNDRIQKFTPDGQFVAKFGVLGSSPGQLNEIFGLCIGPNSHIYVVDTRNKRIQVFKKIDYAQGLSKAIIVAGGGNYPGNTLWNATQMCANFAYRTLTYQGFTKDTICYLTSNMNLDLDDNGELDDVDFDATNSNLEQAITEWAADANSVVLYLVDHGGDGTFRMSGTETLSAPDLDTWLDTLQGKDTCKVTVVYDACESGSFVSNLTPPSGKERILITSTSPSEHAYFVTQGSVSFSSFFWTHIFNGLNIKDAFDLAKEAIGNTTEHQNPLLDDNGNGVGNEPSDGNLAQNTHIGIGTVIYGDAPVIESVSADQTINHTASADLFASSVTDNDGIARVWAIIRPPNYSQGSSDNPIQGLPSLDLMPVGQDRFEGTYDGFNIEGTYQLAIYARDRIGNTSIPKLTTVSVENPLRRRAVIVAAGSQSDALWPAIEKNTALVYEALTFQGYSDDDIYFMSPVAFSTGWDASSTLSNLQYAIETWAEQSTQDIVVYLAGKGDNEALVINPTETLLASDLDIWLDGLQNILPGKATVTVIYDADCSGSFLPFLTPPENKERILIASTGPNKPAHFLCDGDISFSAFFWQQVINGASVRDAFVHAINASGYACQSQVPMLDDNGNGIGNETGQDGRLARNYTIGVGIIMAGDAPLIGTISPEQTLSGETSATIWVEDVTTTGTIDRVWAIITPPGFDLAPPNNQGATLITLELSDVGGGRYAVQGDAFSTLGTYHIAVYAMDVEGDISLPKETAVYQLAGPDIYEEDDSFDQAKINIVYDSPAQHHNFHDANDQDWVKFYGIGGEVYEIEVSNAGSRCDAVLELYDTDGTTLLKGPWSWGFEGEDELMDWNCPRDDIYFVMVRQQDPNVFGEDTEYDLAVYWPVAVFPGFLIGTIRSASSGVPIENAKITTDAISSDIGFPNGTYRLPHPAGTFTVTAWATGYELMAHSVFIEGDFKDSIQDFDLTPTDSDGDGYPDISDVFPNDPTEWLDTDEDGIGNNADTDDDGDGLPDTYEENMTETDPLNPDTDGNGTSDDLEDPDFDGFTNAQEYTRGTHPNISTICFYLSAGLNIFGYPVEVPEGYTSYNLIADLGTEVEVSKIQRYNSATKSYQTTIYENGEAGKDVFDIISGEGYLVYMKVGKAVFFDGIITNPAISLVEGLNIVSIPSIPSDYYSYDLLSYLARVS